MSELIYWHDGTRQSVSIPWALNQEAVIGSDSNQAQYTLEKPGVLPKHVTITNLPESPGYLLLNHAEESETTKVNGFPVYKYKFIRHGDQITLGEQTLLFTEFQHSYIQAESPFLDARCELLRHGFNENDEIVVCRCGQPSHMECWLLAERCGRHDCAYPHRSLLVKFLQKDFAFEVLTPKSPLIGKYCNHKPGYHWDQIPFAVDKTQSGRIAYCPKCKMPFHEACWLSLKTCPTPNCGYDVREKVLSFFSLGSPEGSLV
ncbi:MAG: hypothetical protein JW963_04895 [Anaerolineales bacterium]|nr:hypothetical protein [Anaerolineales bacterium]